MLFVKHPAEQAPEASTLDPLAKARAAKAVKILYGCLFAGVLLPFVLFYLFGH